MQRENRKLIILHLSREGLRLSHFRLKDLQEYWSALLAQDVFWTLIERYGCQMDVKTTLCANWDPTGNNHNILLAKPFKTKEFLTIVFIQICTF